MMYFFTEEGLENFKKKIDLLDEEYKKAIYDNVGNKETNINESGSFLFTRNEIHERYMNKKNKYNNILINSVLIESTNEFKNWDEETVIKKCEVTLDFDGEVEVYKILGYGETDIDNNIMTYDAPLAKLIIGKKLNSTIDLNGINVKIIGISPINKSKKLIYKPE